MYFEELSNFSALQAVMFPTGVLLTIAGVFILTQRDDSTGVAVADQQKVNDDDTAETGPATRACANNEETTENQHRQLKRANTLSALDDATKKGKRPALHRSDTMHVSQMSMRPSLALSVVGSVGSLTASLKAALKAAGEKADREGGLEPQREGTGTSMHASSSEITRGDANLHDGVATNGATEASIAQFAQQRERELRQQAVAAMRASGAPPPSRSSGASLQSSAGSGFMALQSLNEHSLSTHLKVRGLPNDWHSVLHRPINFNHEHMKASFCFRTQLRPPCVSLSGSAQSSGRKI